MFPIAHTVRVKNGCQNMACPCPGCLVIHKDVFAPVGPFSLQQAYDGAVSISADTVYATVATSPDMKPDLFRVLPLKQRDAEMLECIRPHHVQESPSYFPCVLSPRSFGLIRMIEQRVQHDVWIEAVTRQRLDPTIRRSTK